MLKAKEQGNKQKTQAEQNKPNKQTPHFSYQIKHLL